MIRKLTPKINRFFGLKYFQDEVAEKSYWPYYTYKDGKTPLSPGWIRLKDENEDFYVYIKGDNVQSQIVNEMSH